MRNPDFILVGHLKCGSTSLSKYLSYNSQIYIKHDFEPKFISSLFIDYPQNGPGAEDVDSWIIKDEDAYLDLFANREEKRVGENSSELFYYAEQASETIFERFGDIDIIIILRNPVDRAYSAYMHMLRDDRENLSFEEALEAEQLRQEDNWDSLYYYKSGGFYYEKLDAYFRRFTNVHVLLTEELASHQKKELQNICRFLDVEYEASMEMNSRFNESGKIRWPWLDRQMMNPDSPLRRFVRPLVRITANKQKREKLFNSIKKVNLEKKSMNPNTRERLKRLYQNDVEKCATLLNKDLLNIWGFGK